MTVTLTSGESPYKDTLGFYDKSGQLAVTLGTNKDRYGKQVKLSADQIKRAGYKAGDELLFGIDVKDTKKRFFTGAAGRNPDGYCHAQVVPISRGTFDVGFEDLSMPGSDLDYNDCMWTFYNLCRTKQRAGVSKTSYEVPVSVGTTGKVFCPK